MFVFNTSSWHFKLVLYVFGKSFFFKKQMDDKKLREKIKSIEEIARRKYPNNDEELTKAIFSVKFHEDENLFTYVPKPLNFCPYCRAVVWSIVLFPFVVLSKLIPRREKKPFDIKKSKRNMKIIKILAMILIGSFGIHQLIVGNYGLAIFHFAVASFQIWGGIVFKLYFNWQEKRLFKKPKQRPKQTTQKNPSLLMAYLHSNHNKICPQVTFVDENDTEVRV